MALHRPKQALKHLALKRNKKTNGLFKPFFAVSADKAR
jgi:hypothetical protein